MGQIKNIKLHIVTDIKVGETNAVQMVVAKCRWLLLSAGGRC